MEKQEGSSEEGEEGRFSEVSGCVEGDSMAKVAVRDAILNRIFNQSYQHRINEGSAMVVGEGTYLYSS